MQGDALILEEQANAILAAHYEEAKERGEVAKVGNPNIPGGNNRPTQPDLGIDPKVTMRGRLVNAAEEFEPGIMQRVVQEMIDEGLEPTRAKLQAAVEAAADIRLAIEYDAAQERGEVAKHGGDRASKVGTSDLALPTLADLNLTKQQLDEARIIRDGEDAEPGVAIPSHADFL